MSTFSTLAIIRLVEESINNSISVNLGIDHPGAIGNNDLLVAIQR